jgi:hypothetical protein
LPQCDAVRKSDQVRVTWFGGLYQRPQRLTRWGFRCASIRDSLLGRIGDEGVDKNFPRTVAAAIGHLPAATPIELWWQDEMRVGQKNGIVRQWARTGSRPRQPNDQRYESAYLFGAICPAKGTGAALVMPAADSHAMQTHLHEISRTVARGAHAVLLLDRAGWHTSSRLAIPRNISLVYLPARSPELNPVENVWQYLRQNNLSNCVFPPTTPSSRPAARPGTDSSTNPGSSCPSACANGPITVKLNDPLVLGQFGSAKALNCLMFPAYRCFQFSDIYPLGPTPFERYQYRHSVSLGGCS